MFHTYTQHVFYWMRGLTAPDVATMIALAVLMLVFKGGDEHRHEGREQYFVIVVVTLMVAAWMGFSDGWPAIVRYGGLYAICALALVFSEAFGVAASVLAAAVLVVANAGCAHLLK